MHYLLITLSLFISFNVWAKVSILVAELELTAFERSILVDQCHNSLPKLRESFDQFKDFDKSEIDQDGKEMLSRMWIARLTIREHLPFMPKECVYEARSLFRAIRAVEDIVGEVYYKEKQLIPQEIDFFKQPVPLKDHAFYHGHLQNPKFSSIDFKAGDIMITRGVSYQSALIAQIAKPEGQYSHIVQTHVKDGEMFTIESYISSGMDIFDEKYALLNENARIILLRHHNEEVAQEASTYVYELAKKRKDEGNPIQYDFLLDFEDHEKVSCAEIARWGYDVASSGEIKIPFYPSKITLKDKKFLKSLGLTARDIFEPIDMEVDPRFDIVLEWRDYRFMRDSRHKDAVLKAILSWIDTKDYKLHSNFSALIASTIIYPLRDTFLWPKLLKMGVPNFSSNIPKSTFKTNVRLTQIADVLIKYVRKIDRGFPMTMNELNEALEKYRLEDLEKYQRTGHADFHYYFRANDHQIDAP